ncbi:MAG: class II D-tagatose-bisphosphate aldolase, non-catalytic subunit [Candidatus Omnitrophota bacterium]
MLTAKLGIAPLSTEIIEAAFRYSHNNNKELMLIASKNQLDYVKGYVNGWTTKDFRKFVGEVKKRYANSNVRLCRDHCGPGFNGRVDLEDTYRTIEEDITNGFDLIHIDFCHFKENAQEKLAAAKKAVEYCLRLNPNIRLEVGSDGNSDTRCLPDRIEGIKEEIDFFQGFCVPEFYVVPTGSLVRAGRQAGSFNKGIVDKIARLIHSKGIKSKEHNADYLSKDEIFQRKGAIEAMNIAPQLGSVQTQLVIDKSKRYGVDCNDFLNIVYKNKKWTKWIDKHSSIDKTLALRTAGHYHYTSDEYKKIIRQLNTYENIYESIIDSITGVIDHYESCR